MTKSAKEYLMSCLWPGNEVQVHVFAERLVLTSAKRSIDEISVRQAMDQFNHGKANDRTILLQNAGALLGISPMKAETAPDDISHTRTASARRSAKPCRTTAATDS